MDHPSPPPAIPICPLIARDPELESLLDLWRSARLVTLYGQSGVGKSLLAHTAADRLADEHEGEVRCVDAGALTSGAALLRLLTRVRRRAAGADGQQRARPSSTPLFLLLDDLPSATREATRGLLQWLVLNPAVHLLIVTQRPLDLVGEVAVPLAPLTLSAPETDRSPAAELFEFYAHRAGRRGSSMDAETVGTICQALDGLPAALEAAAGLVGAVAEAEIVRISRDEPLSLGLRGRPLTETAAATWRELPGQAREYLLANAGWPASFDAEAGRYMAGSNRAAEAATLLVRLGLLHAVGGTARPRFRIAGLLRAWMRRVGAMPSPEQEDRRARFQIGWAQRAFDDGSASAFSPEDLDGVGWSWRWLAGQRDGQTVAQFARGVARPLLHLLGHGVEAAELLSSAIAWARTVDHEWLTDLEECLAEAEICQGELDAAERRLRRLVDQAAGISVEGDLRLSLAAAMSARGRQSAAREMRSAAIAGLRSRAASTGDAQAALRLAWALLVEADDRRRLLETEAAEMALAESHALFERCGAKAGHAAVLALRAELHLDRGETLEAARCARESRALAELIGCRPGIARALQLMGRTADDPSGSSSPMVERAVSLWEEMARPYEAAEALLDLAWLAGKRESEPGRAMSAARQALALARRHGFVAVEAAALLGLAGAYRAAGDAEREEGYLLEATAVAERTDDEGVQRQIDRFWKHLRTGITEGGCALDPDKVTLAVPTSSSASRAVTDPPTPPLLVRLLGPLTVEGPRGSLSAADLRPKEQRVLARLALSPGEVVLRDELLDLFWHRSPVASAERSLRTVVSSLRGSLRRLLDGPSIRLITGRGDGYQLEAPACAVDAHLFARAVREAREASSGADSERARSGWRRAEELYRGDLLLPFQYEDWCLTARERLRNEFLEVLFQLAGLAMAEGDTELACRRALRMVEIDPTEERAHRLLMRCYVFLDRPSEALRQFERCRTALWEELAARPGPLTLSLLQAIREGVTIGGVEDEPEPVVYSSDSLLR